MKKIRNLILMTVGLAGCTADTIRKKELLAQGNPQDVAFCKFEAAKSPVGDYVTTGVFGQALEDEYHNAEVFNACMDYRSSLPRVNSQHQSVTNLAPVQSTAPTKEQQVIELQSIKGLSYEEYMRRYRLIMEK